jgi:hypothetical protein
MTTASRSLATAPGRARSLAACSAELHHQLGRDQAPVFPEREEVEIPLGPHMIPSIQTRCCPLRWHAAAHGERRVFNGMLSVAWAMDLNLPCGLG